MVSEQPAHSMNPPPTEQYSSATSEVEHHLNQRRPTCETWEIRGRSTHFPFPLIIKQLASTSSTASFGGRPAFRRSSARPNRSPTS